MAEKSPDDELRALHRLAQQAALHGYPNPDRTGCPGIRILEEVAATPAPFKHPAYEHIKTCSPCLKEMLDLRGARIRAQRAAAPKPSRAGLSWSFAQRPRRQWAWVMVAVAILIVASAAVKLFVGSGRPAAIPDRSTSTLVDRTISLWDRDTLRGGEEPTHLEAVWLPAARVRLKLVLPRFSESGNYTIAVTRDSYGIQVLAKAAGPTVANGPREIVTVVLDLRSATAGAYFLQTTRDQSEASYYYPVKVG